MKNLLTILIAVTLTVSAFGQAGASTYAIIPFDASSMDWIFKNCKPAGLNGLYNDIKSIEIILKQSIDTYNIEQKKKNLNDTINIASYKRQYVAVVNNKGEKEVWINCFCNDPYNPKKDWTKEFIMAEDGGKCYFNLKVNLTAKKYYDLFVNGNG